MKHDRATYAALAMPPNALISTCVVRWRNVPELPFRAMTSE